MIINAEDTILGRLATYAAKQALLGEKVFIINCEKAIITGSRKDILNDFAERIARGNPFKGPYFPRRSDMIVRRTVRGMLPRRKSKGRIAYKNVVCYLGMPESLKNEKIISLENANINRLRTLKYLYLKEISRVIGGRVE